MISPGVGNGNALQLSEKPAVAAVCAAPARRHGRQRRTGLVNTTRTAGKRHKKEKSGERPTVCWRELDSNLRSLSKPEILRPRYAQVICIMQTYLGAGAAMVQPFFFCCASNHSTEPGWGTF